MPVWIRRTVAALAVVALILAAGAAWLVAHFNPDAHKSAAIEWMKARHDRTLEIGGPVRLSLFPRIEVQLLDVALSEAGRPEPFVVIDEASLGIELLPLLQRRVSVGRVEARGVRLVLLRDARGRRNIDGLLKPDTVEPPSTPGLQFDVSRIQLTDVRARVKDEKEGIDGELVLKELRTGRIANQLESSLSLVAQFGFMTPALKGELSGSTRFTPDLASASVQLQDMNLDYKGDAPGASSVDATLRGALSWDGAKASLAGSGLNLRVTANTAGLRLAGSTLAVERFAMEPQRKSFSLNQLQLRVRGSRAGTPVALELDWPELDVSGATLKGSALSGRFTSGSDAPTTVEFKSDAPSGSFENVRVPAFEARLASSGSARKLAGSLRGEFVLQPVARSATLDHVELRIRLDEPGLKPLELAISGRATASSGNAHWAMDGDVNKNTFSSVGTARLSGITPNLKTWVHFESLDLNGLLPPAPGLPLANTNNASIDLAALRSVNGSLGLRIDQLALRHYRLSDVSLDATLDAGMLRASSVKGGIWGGSFEGTAFADARASRVALKVGAQNVNINALLRDVAELDLLEGTGRVDVDIESAGRTAAELKTRLKGKGTLQLRDGAVKGVDLPRSLRQAKPALALKQDAAFKPSKTDATDYQELNASFVIAAGVARSTDLELASPLLRLAGEGTLDIVKNRVDSVVRASVIDATRAADGAELAALAALAPLKGVTVPVHFNGPVDAIQWRVQWSAAVAAPPRGQARAEAESRLRDRQRNKPKGPLP